MWIDYIGEIAMLAVLVLVAAHFGLHLYFKHKRKQRQKNDDNSEQNS